MHSGGAALIIDYGHVESAIGDTLQAVGEHDFADPLRTPGEVDLTAHVDFQALAQAAESMGARVHGPVTQSEFLRGSASRSARLRSRRARRRTRPPTIDGGAGAPDRRRPHRHGRLFKALGVSDPKLGALPGFEA